MCLIRARSRIRALVAYDILTQLTLLLMLVSPRAGRCTGTKSDNRRGSGSGTEEEEGSAVLVRSSGVSHDRVPKPYRIENKNTTTLRIVRVSIKYIVSSLESNDSGSNRALHRSSVRHRKQSENPLKPAQLLKSATAFQVM